MIEVHSEFNRGPHVQGKVKRVELDDGGQLAFIDYTVNGSTFWCYPWQVIQVLNNKEQQ